MPIDPFEPPDGDPDRFWSKVAKTSTCWLWLGATRNGYGVAIWGGGPEPAHRTAWMLTFKRRPGSHLHHTCGERLCVRPDHLVELTASEHSRLHGKAWRAS